MHIIDSFDKLNIGKYAEIQAISADTSLDELDRQSRILAVLADEDVNEVLHLPINEYKDLVRRMSFLAPGNLNYHPVARKYICGGFDLVPVRDFRRLETAQYIDFQTYSPDLDKHLVEFLSVILLPKGHRYNEGYDIADVQRAIREELSVADGVSIAGFFLTWCRKSIEASLNYSERMAKELKDRTKREQMLEQIAEQRRALQTSGDGLQP